MSNASTFSRSRAEHRTALHRYFTLETINVRLPATRDAAYTSLAYNVGPAGAAKP
ncbi:MAG: lysozyme [Mesorhizobium sp.]|nr:MAG: lysozyme [Mesorhizobium sp.]